MIEKSLADRVSALEAKVGNKTLAEQFREQGEMLDQRFRQIHERLDEIATDVGVLKTDVGMLKTDVSFLTKEVTSVREGISILSTLSHSVSAAGSQFAVRARRHAIHGRMEKTRQGLTVRGDGGPRAQ